MTNPFPQLLASTLKTKCVLIKFNSGHTRKLKLFLKKKQFQLLPETLPDSRIRTKTGLVVVVEGWSNTRDTPPLSRESLCNNCSCTVSTIRTGLPTKMSMLILIRVIGLFSASENCSSDDFRAFSVFAKTKMVTCLYNQFFKISHVSRNRPFPTRLVYQIRPLIFRNSQSSQ